MGSLHRIFVVVPAATMSSPIKGAAALANALSRDRDVAFVALKPGSEGFQLLDERVEPIRLFEMGEWPARLRELRRLIVRHGGKRHVGVVSLCLSADFVNMWCRDVAVTCGSVRGNLPRVYPETYGRIGKWIAHRHLRMLRRLDHVVSMTRAMADQVQSFIGRPSPVIGNFVDELPLEKFRNAAVENGPLRFAFAGSMVRNKQPQMVLDAVRALQHQGVDARLDAYGHGPLLSTLREQARSLPVPQSATFHGHVDNPYTTVSRADVLVLPSLSEGTSRSAMEALYLGVPCVARDIDGNDDLIRPGENGGLFAADDELAPAMLSVARWSRARGDRRTGLLPEPFRQAAAARRYLELLEG